MCYLRFSQVRRIDSLSMCNTLTCCWFHYDATPSSESASFAGPAWRVKSKRYGPRIPYLALSLITNCRRGPCTPHREGQLLWPYTRRRRHSFLEARRDHVLVTRSSAIAVQTHTCVNACTFTNASSMLNSHGSHVALDS